MQATGSMLIVSHSGFIRATSCFTEDVVGSGVPWRLNDPAKGRDWWKGLNDGAPCAVPSDIPNCALAKVEYSPTNFAVVRGAQISGDVLQPTDSSNEDGQAREALLGSAMTSCLARAATGSEGSR